MKKLSKLIIAFMFAGTAAACVTEDPRGTLREPFLRASEDTGLGERCGSGFPSCQAGLTCYDNACTPSDIVAACDAAPSCGDGLCLARGDGSAESPFTTFCNCPSGEVWDGDTCVTDASIAYEGNTLSGQTCPFELLLDNNGNGVEDPGDIPDTATADCTAGTCTAASGGICLENYVSHAGDIGTGPFAIEVREPVAADADCTIVYEEGDSTGLILTVSGAVVAGLPTDRVTVTLSEAPGDDDGSYTVWPQGAGFSAPAGDAAYVDVEINGVATLPATGGFFDLEFVGGSDSDDDGELDTGIRVGGSLYLGFGGGAFFTAAYTIECS